jgi:hypothetical protein
MSLGALLLPLLALVTTETPPGPAYEVRLERVEERLALVLVLGEGAPRLSVAREGGEVVLRVESRPAEPPVLPPAEPPLEDLRLVLGPRRLEVRAKVARGLSFEVQREADRVRVVFGARAEEPPPDAADFQALYRSLFPGESGPSRLGEAPTDAPAGGTEGGDGLRLGPLRLRPALLVGWIDGETTFGPTPEPVRDGYFQVEPRLGASLQARLLGQGQVSVAYEPIVRTRPALRSARRMAHEVNASLDQPLGAALALRGSAHLVWDVLDTVEIDPGREYFFALGRYRRDLYGAGLRFKGAGRLDLDLSATWQRARFSEPAYFFDYERRGLLAELGYELGPNLRAGLGYVRETVPATAGRREAESRTHGARAALYGDIAPLLTGELAVGYEHRENPFAAVEGREFDGLTVSARLTKTFTRASSLDLLGSRYTTLSAFEGNGFYVANDGQLVLTLPLPLELSLRVGGALQRNEYRVDAAGLGAPRRDTIRGLTLGLGRPLTRWSFVRADYRRDRRDSNLDEFDADTWTLIVQVGLGWLGRTATR